ncbi:MAG: DUF4349 domain-containing protein [Gaiellaceae bacterium]
MPATDIDFEREFAELVRELRALPTAAPGSVRERARALGEPVERRTIPWRKSFLVLAPACLFALFAAAAVHGVLESGAPKQQALTHWEAAGGAEARLNPSTEVKDAGALASPLVPPASGRHQDYEASIRLRVKDLDALTDRTNEAMRIVKTYGGFVASVTQSTPAGAPGESDLVLRVPVAHVEQALVQLSELGTVLDRQLSIVDLEAVLRQQRERIVRLKVFIARATEQLQGDLPADVRLRLQLQLQDARAALAQSTGANKATLREAALSRISLTVTTQKGETPVAKSSSGRFQRAVREAGSFLAGAGAVALFLLIVLSPLIVLALAGALGLRAYRRREERRLLAA